MLSRLHPGTFKSTRLFHVSAQSCHLVAPPDPVSHMRPIIYDDAPPPSPPSLLRHPYSLSEFRVDKQTALGDLELRLTLQRQQLDAFHHDFWFDSNTRFNKAKEAILSSLPETYSPLDKEHALSDFYRQWVTQEKDRTDSYTSEWRKRNFALLKISALVKLGQFSNILTFKKSTTSTQTKS